MAKMIIGKTYKFDAAHYIPGHVKCGSTHGHTWTVEIALLGEIDPDTCMVMDFHTLDYHVNYIVSQLDHKLLNDIIKVPTCENISIFIRENLKRHLPETVSVDYIKVQEGEGGYAIAI